MDIYFETVDKIGDAILDWVDPEKVNLGYTEGWWLTDFRTAASIALGYLAFVLVGSLLMKVLPAMDPYPIKFAYNVSQIFLCAYMTVEGFLLAYRNGYSWMPCNPASSTNPPIANLLWLFYVSKVWDFWDTFFIVIGKKWRQLSFLHVYHHFTIFLFYWLNSKVMYDGDIYLTIVLNGFIHTVMYTYYFICMHTKDHKTGKSLPIWWKSSLTLLQLFQFVTMMAQASFLLITDCKSGVNLKVTACYLVYILTLFGLFAQFFVKSYGSKSKKTNQEKVKSV
eukprot:CAMPEP_0197839908 /NCGR_PEP_ID=MMETSP1437-20131217/44929_1 /TAXON_ID=49252 ORGANISM="Eucampia antarctica, Strain CCMP1452" /NCGR_SAMPLE_ID=MMETSP1437 /ASSEMBLY_ACC=CAM_ASM_001096 /LENGTH=279 /DNA_ID=CAMNT_0043449369 /DNA_START=105 /DNA_END=944 /DNA_ORIENTATION=-